VPSRIGIHNSVFFRAILHATLMDNDRELNWLN
jgi:hypothetical protein